MEAMLWSQMGAMLPLVSYPGIPAWVFRNLRESQEKMGKDGWVPKIFFYRPWSVEGKTGKRMIFRGETMRGEASCPWGDSPGAGAISRGRRRSAQKYLCGHLGTLANPFVRWPLAACVRRGESI